MLAQRAVCRKLVAAIVTNRMYSLVSAIRVFFETSCIYISFSTNFTSVVHPLVIGLNVDPKVVESLKFFSTFIANIPRIYLLTLVLK